MKGILLLLLALVIWMVGGSIAMLVGDFYMHKFHPDGLTHWGFVWRAMLFGIPDFFVLASSFFIYSAALVVSPWRKTVGVVLLASGAFLLWRTSQGLDPTNSTLVHVVANASSIVVGLMGIFGKQTDEGLAQA